MYLEEAGPAAKWGCLAVAGLVLRFRGCLVWLPVEGAGFAWVHLHRRKEVFYHPEFFLLQEVQGLRRFWAGVFRRR